MDIKLTDDEVKVLRAALSTLVIKGKNRRVGHYCWHGSLRFDRTYLQKGDREILILLLKNSALVPACPYPTAKREQTRACDARADWHRVKWKGRKPNMDTALTTDTPGDDAAETASAIARIIEQIQEVR